MSAPSSQSNAPLQASPAYPMPEDPPEFGDDGLDYFTREANVAVSAFPEDESAPVKKEVPPGTMETDLTVDLVRQNIARMDEGRRLRVLKRRHPSNPILKVFQKVVPYGGILSSAFNLASSTLGGGIIAIPAAFQLSGIGMGVVYLSLCSILAVYSFMLLAIVAERTGLRNWEQITRQLLGRGADYFLVFIMWTLCFGGDVSYIISMGGVLRGFVRHSASSDSFIASDGGIRLLTSVVWLVAILPLCLPKEINSLRIVSVVAIAFLVLFVICMVVHSGKTLHTNGIRDGLVHFQSGNQAIGGLSIFMFAYISQVNAYEVLGEMSNPSVMRMTIASVLGVGICLALYLLAGLFAYLEFGPTVKDSVLDMYDPVHSPLMGIAYAGIVLKLCVGFALHLIPCRDAIYHVLGISVHNVAWWKNALLCAAQATLALIAGLFIPRITTVFGLLGGFCGGFIGFVFPALFMMFAGNFTWRGAGGWHFIGTYMLLLVGVIAIVFGTSAAIYSEVMAN